MIFEELKLRQEKGLINNDTLIICVEDPEKPIGSGGATLNALLLVAEALSAQKKYKVNIKNYSEVFGRKFSFTFFIKI